MSNTWVYIVGAVIILCIVIIIVFVMMHYIKNHSDEVTSLVFPESTASEQLLQSPELPPPDYPGPPPPVPAVPPVPPPPVPAGPVVYTNYYVREGDNIAKIASYFYNDETRAAVIASENNIPAPYYIYIGQLLRIPNATQTKTTYTVQAGDTINEVAYKILGSYNLGSVVAYQNNLSSPFTIYPGQTLHLFQ